MRLKAKRDANEAAIVEALQAHGIGVYRLNDPGAPDLLAWEPGDRFMHGKPRAYPLEVKSKTGRLTRAQRAYQGPRWVVRTPAEALAVFGIREGR